MEARRAGGTAPALAGRRRGRVAGSETERSDVDHPVFDFHARLGPQPSAADRLLAAMDSNGVARTAVCSGGVIDLDRLATQVMEGGHVENDADNEAVLAACRRSGERLVPFFFANPHRDPDHYRARAAEFRGVELSPAVHGVALTDERTTAVVEVAAEFRHPVYVVCIGSPGCGPAALATLARRFPEVTFVLGHCGFVGIDLYSINLVAPQGNILAETSGCYTGIARAAVERLGAHRVLFGTEYPLQHHTVELAKMRALDLDGQHWRELMWRNTHRLLGEPVP